MSRLCELFHQIMEAPAHLRSVTMLLMVGTLLAVIPFGGVRSEGFGPPKVGQVLDQRKEFLVGYGKGCEGWQLWAAWLFLLSIGRPRLVRKFGTSFHTAPGCLFNNQNLLGGRTHIIFQH